MANLGSDASSKHVLWTRFLGKFWQNVELAQSLGNPESATIRRYNGNFKTFSPWGSLRALKTGREHRADNNRMLLAFASQKEITRNKF